MFRLVPRAVAGLLIMPFLALASAVAPEHVHEADADHSHALVHRHFESHEIASHDHDGAEFADDSEHVVWLDNATLHQSTYQFDAPEAVLAEGFDAVSTSSSWTATPFDDAAPVHGPPRPRPAPRGPPLFTA